MSRRAVRQIADAALAVALAVMAVLELAIPLNSVQGTGSVALTMVVAVALCLSLAFRRVWPLSIALLVLLAWPIVFSAQPLLVVFWGGFVPITVATYSVARYGTPRAGVIGGLAAIGCLVFLDLRIEELCQPGELIFHWSVVGLAWVVGTIVRVAEQRAEASRARAVEIEAESRTNTLAALAEERARIARELHDVVAHAVTVMVVQAGAAEQLVTDDPEVARTALGTIRTTGAEALAEMRRVVSMLRDDDNTLRPQPGIAAIPALLDEARTSGLVVDYAVDGTPRPLALGLDLAAFRIIQEALTNVRRHAAASRVVVSLRYDVDAVGIEVRDDGQGVVGSAGGNGLVGMRERAALYGGSLDAGGDGVGFTVRAELPTETRG